jgi:hypothetical protein
MAVWVLAEELDSDLSGAVGAPVIDHQHLRPILVDVRPK